MTEPIIVELRPLRIGTPLKFTRIKCEYETKIKEIYDKIRFGLGLTESNPLFLYLQKIQGQPLMEDMVGDLTKILGTNSVLRIDYSSEPIYC